MERQHSASLDNPALLEVADVRQAWVFTDPVSFEFFKPLLARSRTVGQAASAVGCLPDAMLYRVRKLVPLGLL